MPAWTDYALLILAAYLMGAIPTGYWLVKALKGEDIRQHGSGSTGTTNVKRVAGNHVARVVLILDILKGTVPVLLAKALFPALPWLAIVVAFAVLIGHSKSIFIGFSGGKAAASSLGTLFGLSPWVALILAVIAFTLFKLTRTVSIASLISVWMSGPLLFVFGAPFSYIIYGVLTAAMVTWLHRSNIQRLLSGKENKI